MSDINKIGGDNTTSLINKNGNTSIEQNANISNFENFQKEVASKTLCRRAICVVTGVVGGARVIAGGIFTIKVGIAAVIGALAGLVGAAAAPFVLIGMGALCIAAVIAGIVLFAKNSRKNIYIKELNKLLQSDKVDGQKRAISYLNEMIAKNKNTIEYNAAENFLGKNINPILACIDEEHPDLCANTTALLTNMIKSKNLCMKAIHEIIITKHKENFAEKIKNCLGSSDLNLKSNTDLLLRTMINGDDANTRKLATQLLIEIVQGNDNNAKEIFENGILNLGLIKKMIYDDGCKKEMIKLLSLMSNDKGPNEQNEINGDKRKHLNEIVVDLVGSEIAEKLGKLNLGNDDSGYLNENNVNEIVEGIKSLRTTIPAKLKEGDIVYKGDFEFDEKLSVLEKDKNTEEISEKIFKSFENKDSLKKEDNQTKLKTLLSQNNGLKGDGDKPNSNFLSKKDQEYNKDNNNFDKNKIKEKGSADYKRNLVSLKFESEKYILTNGESEKFLEAFNKVDVQEVSRNKEDNKNNNSDKKEPENVSNLEKFFGKIKNQKGINDNKIGTLEKLKDRIFSFPEQGTQDAVTTFFQNKLGMSY